MPKRKYTGNPIDATMSYLSEIGNSGETVAGSTEDDQGDENTIAVPSFVDENRYTDAQLETLEQKALHPDEKLNELVKHIPLSYTDASSFLAEFRREHEDVLKHHQLYDKYAFEGSPDKEKETESVAEHDGARIIQYFKSNPEASVKEARNDLSLSTYNDQQVGSYKGAAMRELDADDSDEQSDEAPLADVHERLDSLEARLENRPEPQTLSIDGVLDSDALYRLVNGESLTEEERRELFEVVVNDGG